MDGLTKHRLSIAGARSKKAYVQSEFTMLTRRQFGSSTLVLSAQLFLSKVSGASTLETTRLLETIRQLESKSGGRLGVTVLDTQTGASIHHRGDERFPMCSTFKVLASAAILNRLGEKLDGLDQRVRIEQSDIVENSPITREHVGPEGMSLRELCEAAITRSDNTAANLLLRNIGGTAGLTAFARSLGDDVTRLDRIETELNEAAPGDLRDTTSPNAMAENYRRLVLGNVLPPAGREQLSKWMIANKTGDSRLRAGLPQGWRVGDKTGAGAHGTNNDVAIVWPPQRSALVVAVYLTGASVDMSGQNEVIASVGREVGKEFG
ncbi:class A beta-lactamase [Bradyrhizobium sp. CCBAU 11357]|uniref:class A beta-lactamase n=1 Tax=Bradyrhizobium sp. CCBAU 11357 TaxID=1630808 RepID=UPI002302F9E5|nr:class A beta-lactamase [Bradyrhizobium sp. CCBAU 11357]